MRRTDGRSCSTTSGERALPKGSPSRAVERLTGAASTATTSPSRSGSGPPSPRANAPPCSTPATASQTSQPPRRRTCSSRSRAKVRAGPSAPRGPNSIHGETTRLTMVPDLVLYCERENVPFVTFEDFSSIHQTVKDVVEGKTTVREAAKGRL